MNFISWVTKFLFVIPLIVCSFSNASFGQCPGTVDLAISSTPCKGTPITFINKSTGTADSYTWKWDDGSPNTGPVLLTNQTHTFTVSKTYNVYLVKTCGSNKDSSKVTFTIVDFPTVPTITTNPANSCGEQTVNFNISNIQGGISYKWNFGDPASGKKDSAQGTSVTHKFSAKGGSASFSVVATAINAQGCKVLSTPTITSNKSTPKIVIIDNGDFLETNGSFTRCLIDGNSIDSVYTFTFDNQTVTDNPNTQYTWKWGDGTANTVVNTNVGQTHEYKKFGVNNLVVIASNSITGCTSSDTIPIINEKFPSASLSIPPAQVNICDGTTVSIDNNSKNATSYVWVWGDGLSDSTDLNTPISHKFNLSNSDACAITSNLGKSITVTLYANNSCFQHSNNSPINVRPAPRPTFTTNFPLNKVCKTSALSQHAVTFTPSVCPTRTIANFPTKLEFDFGDAITSGPGNLNTQTINPNQPLTATHTYRDAGKYVVKLKATNSCGEATFVDTIYVLDPAIASFTNGGAKNSSTCATLTPSDFTPASNCGPFTVNLKSTSTNLTPSDNISWSVSPSTGVKFGSSNSTSSASLNDNVSFSTPGTYTVMLSVSNNCNSASSTACAVVNVKGIPSISSAGTSIGGLGSPDNPNFVLGTGLNAGSYVACGTQTVSTFSVDNPDATTTGYSWNIDGTGGTSDPALTNATQQNLGNVTLTPGTYTVSSTVSNSCGNASVPPVNVLITTPPVVNPGGTVPAGGISKCTTAGVTGAGTMKELVVCSGVSTNLGSGANVLGTTYNWTTSPSNPSVVNPNTINTSVTLTNSSSSNTCHKYFLEADNGACKKKDSVLVVVKPAPAVNIGAIGATGINADTSICEGTADYTLLFSPTGGTWTGISNPAIINGVGLFKPVTAGVGLHTVKYAYTDPLPGGCTIEKTKVIRINPKPVVSIGTVNANYCESAIPFNLSGSPSGGTWAGSVVGAITSAGVFTTSVVGAGNSIQLTYEVTDANTCKNSAQKNVTISLPVKAIPGADQSVCANIAAFSLTGFSPAGGTWSGVGSASAAITSGGVFDPSGLSAGTYDVTYTINQGTPCEMDSTKTITVKAIPVVNHGGAYGPFCLDDVPQELKGTPVGGTWTGVGVTMAPADTTFSPSIAGISLAHTLTYTFTNSDNCTESATTSIEVKALPIVNAGTDITICTNATPYQLTGFSPTIGGTGTWSIINQAPSLNSVSNSGLFSPNDITVDTVEYKFSLPSGCFAVDTVKVTVIAPVNADAGNDTTICVNTGIATLNSGATPFNVSLGSSWSGPGVVAGTNQFDPLLLTTGQLNTDIILTYTYGQGNCITTDTKKIKVFAAPTIVAPTVPSTTICGNQGAVIISGYSGLTTGLSTFDSTSGVWSGPGITKIAGTEKYKFDPLVAGASPIAHSLLYTYTDNTTKNCVSTYTHQVSVAPIPVADFTIPALFCKNALLTITNNSTVSFGSVSTNNWNYGDGKVGSIKNNILHGNGTYTFTTSGTYTIDLIAITNAGCKDTVSKSIQIIEPPKAKFSLSKNPLSGCGPLDITIKDLSSGYDSTYVWNFGNGTTSTSYIVNDTTITYAQGILTDTTYYIKLTVKNQCNVAGDVYIDSVKVLPKPVANFGTDKNIGCSPAPFNFNNNSTGKIKGVNTAYMWKFSDGSPSIGPVYSQLINGTLQEPNPGTKFFTYNGKTDTTYFITLVATNTCGVDSVKRSVKVLPNTVNAFFNQNVNDGCSPLQVQFTDFSTGGTFVSYDFGDGNSVIAKTTQHTFTNPGPGNKTFKVYQYVNNGCSYDTTFQIITVYPKPKVAFTMDKTEICKFADITVVNQSQGINSTEWYFGDNTPLVNNVTSNVAHSYDTAGVFTIRMVGKENMHQCVDTIYKTVTVNSPPVIDIDQPSYSGCQPLSINFTKSSSADASSFIWSFGDGNTSSFGNPQHTYNSFGVFSAKVTASNNKGCIDSSKATVTVFEKPVSAFAELSQTDPCVFPINVQYQNNSSVVATSFSWSVDNAFKSTNNHPLISFPGPEDYNVKMVATTPNGCKDSLTLVKKIDPLPVAAFSIADSTGCAPFEVNLTNLSQNATQFIWTFGDGSTSNANEHLVKHHYNVGSYSISLTAKSSTGCVNTIASVSDVINVDPSPVADFSYEAEQDLNLYGTIYFTNTSQNAIKYHWDLNEGNYYDYDSINFTHRYQLFGTKNVVLTATNIFNCTNTIEKQVEVPFFGNLFVPSAFTPDFGNEEVSRFLPKGIGLEKYRIQVFDTWGIVVWESEKLDINTMPEEGWDGTYDGKPLPQGVYVWKVDAVFHGGRQWQGMEYKTGKVKTTGTVTLIR